MRDNGGHAVAMTYSMDAVYDTKPGEVFWSPAMSVGLLVTLHRLRPALFGCSTVLYEGKLFARQMLALFGVSLKNIKLRCFFRR